MIDGLPCVVMIPIIAVFTKYDLLVTHFFREDPAKSKPDAERNASDSLDNSVNELQGEWVKLLTDTESRPTDLRIPCVKVSTKAKGSSAERWCIFIASVALY